MSDVFSEFRASLIGKEFENATRAWPVQALHRMHSVSSVHFDSLDSSPSPFGPTFGCSFSPLPQCSIVVKSLCDARAPAPSPRDTPPRFPNHLTLPKLQARIMSFSSCAQHTPWFLIIWPKHRVLVSGQLPRSRKFSLGNLWKC